MPNEIYHRSNWGESKAEDFGDVYYDHAATNKLYNHSDYYENSDGTDATLKDLNNKASIVLTPTAYSDGSLNTVIPPYGVLPTELVTNGDFDDGLNGWSSHSGSILELEDGRAKVTTVGVHGFIKRTDLSIQSGKIYFCKADITNALNPQLYLNGISNVLYPMPLISGNTYGGYVKTTGNNSTFYIRGNNTDGQVSFIDNVSVKEIQEADFDFSRGSSATRVNEQGLVEDVQILSGELVQNGNFEQIGSELVTNGNFDTDSDWTKQTGWSISDGKAIATSTNGSLYQANDFVSGKIYRIRFEITSYESGGLICRFNNDETNIFNSVGTHTLYFKSDNSFDYVYFLGDNSFTGSIDNVSVKEVGQNWTFGTGWSMGDGVALFDSSSNAGYITQSNVLEVGKKYKLTATVNSGRVGLISYFYDVEQGTPIQTGVDSIFTVKSPNGSLLRLYSHPNDGDAEITDISVVEVTDDTDLPRIDFTDGTGSLLLEPQRTNLVTYSEDFSQSVWTKNDVTVTSGFLAPDGTNTAYKVTKNGSNAHLVGFSGQNTNKRKSIWARTVSGTGKVTLLNVTTDTNALFDITEQWQRFDITHSGADFFYAVDFRNASATLTEVLIWGAQVEDGDYATSYIVSNSGSTTTRSADVANNSGNADLFNDSEGVLYAEIAALADDGTGRRISISDNSSNPDNLVSIALSVYTDTIIGRVRSANTEVAFLTAASQTQTQNNKIAVLYKQNDFRLFINGTQVATDTSGNTPTGLVNLSFDRGNGNDDFYGNVKCVAVFKEALSNDLLERLTGEGYESFRLLAEANNYTII